MPDAVYSVITSGELLDGFERADVVEAFASVFSVSVDKADAFIGKERTIKNRLTPDNVAVYQQRLAKIGMVSFVRNSETGQIVDPAAPSDPSGLSLVPDEAGSGAESSTDSSGSSQPASDSASSPSMLTCPKCHVEQKPSEQCIGCGVYFSKLGRNKKDSAAKRSKTRSQRPAAAATVAGKDAGAVVYVLPIVAAILGALIWKFCAVVLGYEFGIVAWAIGGLIGFVAVMAGGKGENLGYACAAMTLVAIFAGKFLTVEEYKDQFASGDAEYIEEGLQEEYDFLVYDSQYFPETDRSDEAIRQFMFEYDYAAVAPASISVEEVNDFRVNYQPQLEKFAEAAPPFEDWKVERMAEYGDIFAEVSSVELVMETMGLLDILFLILGVSTAYKVATSGGIRPT